VNAAVQEDNDVTVCSSELQIPVFEEWGWSYSVSKVTACLRGARLEIRFPGGIIVFTTTFALATGRIQWVLWTFHRGRGGGGCDRNVKAVKLAAGVRV
jgi:hypothetical protein